MAKILLVEDENLIADLYSQQLIQAGFEVKVIDSGVAALKILTEENFDLVFLDILLPGMHGLEVLRQLKIHHSHLIIPIIIISNLAQSEVITEAFRLGAKGYLIKANFDPEELVEEATKILNERAISMLR